MRRTKYYDEGLQQWVEIAPTAQEFDEHKADDVRHVNQALKDEIANTSETAQQTRADFLAFKSALTEGFTDNIFSESFNNLDALTVTQGYYDESLKRLVV